MKTINAYQVLNESGFPASDELNDLCIFGTKKDTNNFIKHLKYLGHDNFTIRKVKIII